MNSITVEINTQPAKKITVTTGDVREQSEGDIPVFFILSFGSTTS